MASAWKVYLPGRFVRKELLVPATPSVSRAFRRRIEFAPDQVVPHRPADFVRRQSEAVGHQSNFCFP